MTLCVGAIAREAADGDHIVTVTDHMVCASDLSMSTDAIDPKVCRATRSGRWLLMGAGNLSAVSSIHRTFARTSAGKPEDLEDVVSGSRVRTRMN